LPHSPAGGGGGEPGPTGRSPADRPSMTAGALPETSSTFNVIADTLDPAPQGTCHPNGRDGEENFRRLTFRPVNRSDLKRFPRLALASGPRGGWKAG
jgi:hypothetical protein